MAMNLGAQGADELTNAAAEGNSVKVEQLLRDGVHPDSRNKYGRTALQTMDWHYPEIAKLLLQYCANPNFQDPKTGRTSLHDAVQYGIKDTALCLLQGGADASIVDKFGNTPAHIAAREGRHEMVLIFQQYELFRKRNKEGKTAYDLAMEKGHTELAEKIAGFR